MDDYQELYPEMLAEARRMLKEGSDLDEILRALRQRCPSIIQSIKVVRDLKGMPLGEAKELVHNSEAWSDVADSHSELHDRAASQYEGQAKQQLDGSYSVEIDIRKDPQGGTEKGD
jgi:hypothetical protein